MKKPALILLAVVALAAVPLFLWKGLGSSGRGSAPEQSAAAAPVASTTQGSPAPAELDAPEPLETPEGVTATIEEPEVVATERQARPTDESGRRIRGHVIAPPGAPADDSLRVVALAADSTLRQIYGSSGLVALGRSGKPDAIRGEARVQPNGSFDLALGQTDDVWLVVDGRFLYSNAARRVPSGESTAELETELGGLLVGVVRLPDPASGSAEVFEELDVELGPDTANFSMSAVTTGPLFRRSTRADGEGRFEFRGVPAGHTLALEIESDDFADAAIPGLELEPGSRREVEVSLALGGTVTGTVVDEAGRPVEKAEVLAAEPGMWGFPGDQKGETETDAEGRFELAHIPPGKLLLIAEKDGFLPSENQKLELADGERRTDFRLTLPAGAVLAGRVRLGDGTPAAGAAVKVSFDPEAMVGMNALNAARGADGKAQAAADGSFQVSGLGKGPFLVRATLEREIADGVKETWLAKSGSVRPDTRDLDLVLEPPLTLVGRVRTEDGTPIEAFELHSLLEAGPSFLPGQMHKETFEDPQGAFVLRDLEPGRWRVDASADGFGPMEPVVVALPRADTTPIELVLAPAATASGTVLDPDGRAIAGALVRPHAETVERIQQLRGNVKSPEAHSAADGTFLLSGLAAGPNTLVAFHEGFASSEPVAIDATAAAPATGVVLRLRRGGTVTGEVFAADGKPAKNVQVVAQSPGSFDTNMTRTDGAGTFRYEHLTPGSWTVSAILASDTDLGDAEAADASAAMLSNLRFQMIQLDEGEEEHIVLGAPPADPVAVHGRVRHDGQPVTGGLVSFVAEGSKGFQSLKMASLDADGRYEVQLDAPGAYLVTVQITGSMTGLQQHSTEFRETVPEAKEHALNLDLPLGALRGTVYGSDRRPIAGTRVTLGTEGGIQTGTVMGGAYAETSTDDAGRFTFEYLRPGRYWVGAGGALMGGAFGTAAKAGRQVRSGLRIEEGQTLEGIDFRLAEPGAIEGRVVDEAGKAVTDVSVFVRDAEGHMLDRFSMTASKSDGSFRYDGVAEGEYVVSARGKGLASVESAPVRVEAGGKASVELVLRPGTRLEVEVTDGEGEPLAARITVTDEHGREVQGMIGLADLAATFGEAFDGKKQRIGPLPPGTYTVTAVSADGHESSRPVTLDGQAERRLRLRIR